MAYTKYIGKNTSDSHQTSPHWLVTFTRFNIRDTGNYGESDYDEENGIPTRRPLVVENDCISVSVSTSKTNNTPSASITLASGDLNYATAVAPGDFVIINMVNFTSKARELRDRAVGGQPINRIGDGFKGVFKINSVSKVINVDPNSGVKTVRYQITAYGFTEFNNMIYFNPTLGNAISKDVLTYAIGAELFSVLNSKKDIHKVLELIPNIILGASKVEATGESVPTTKKTPFEIPKDVFKLLGIDTGTHAVDLYRIMLGIWNSSAGKDMKEGFNPNYVSNARVQNIPTRLKGKIPIQTTPLVNVRLIDLLKRFSNELINETYCCFRIDKDTNAILPKLIIRQKPFNTEHGVSKDKKLPLPGTRFLTLPRWKISSDLIYSLNVAKNESLRFNFVHIIGTTGNPQIDGAIIATQNADGGTIWHDEEDIKRHGIRPYNKVSNFDWVDGTDAITHAPEWAALVYDWVHSGQLKSNGKITTVGIEEDICIGDNLELQDTVYHIESISHMGTITPDGKKMFRTSLTLVHGVDKRSSKKGPVYPEMDYTDTYLDRLHDNESNYGIMPGFSDTQDIRGRSKGGEEVKETGNKTYTPGGIKNKIKSNDKE